MVPPFVKLLKICHYNENHVPPAGGGSHAASSITDFDVLFISTFIRAIAPDKNWQRN